MRGFDRFKSSGGQALCNRRRAEEVQESTCGSGVGAATNDDGSLLNGRVVVRRNADEMAVGAKTRGERGREREEADLGIAGVSVLRSLGDVFCDDEARFHLGDKAGVLQRGLRGASVGRVFRISDSDGADGGVS